MADNAKMVAFPLGKLVYLGMKQISKPIANQVKIAAKRSPFFGKYVCSLPAHGKENATSLNYNCSPNFIIPLSISLKFS